MIRRLCSSLPNTPHMRFLASTRNTSSGCERLEGSEEPSRPSLDARLRIRWFVDRRSRLAFSKQIIRRNACALYNWVKTTCIYVCVYIFVYKCIPI